MEATSRAGTTRLVERTSEGWVEGEELAALPSCCPVRVLGLQAQIGVGARPKERNRRAATVEFKLSDRVVECPVSREFPGDVHRLDAGESSQAREDLRGRP